MRVIISRVCLIQSERKLEVKKASFSSSSFSSHYSSFVALWLSFPLSSHVSSYRYLSRNDGTLIRKKLRDVFLIQSESSKSTAGNRSLIAWGNCRTARLFCLSASLSQIFMKRERERENCRGIKWRVEIHQDYAYLVQSRLNHVPFHASTGILRSKSDDISSCVCFKPWVAEWNAWELQNNLIRNRHEIAKRVALVFLSPMEKEKREISRQNDSVRFFLARSIDRINLITLQSKNEEERDFSLALFLSFFIFSRNYFLTLSVRD